MFRLQRSFKFLLCIGLITAALGCQSKPKETVGEKVDDTVMTAKVKSAILAEPSLKTLQIDVITTNGSVVRLSGAVDFASSVIKAGQLAGAVAGVTEVKNDLVVK